VTNKHNLALAAFFTASFISVSAVELPNLPLEINGEISPYYWLDLTEDQKVNKGRRITEKERKYYNRFNVEAVYLGFKLNITDDIIGDLTLGYESTYYDYNYIRYAYVDIKNLIPRHDLQIGRIKTPWIYYEDELWGWRNVKRVGVDEYDFVDGSDYGVGVEGTLVEGYLLHHAAFMNGRGYEPGRYYTSGERGKDIEYRVSVFPLAGFGFTEGLSVNGLVHYGNLFADEYTKYWHSTDEDLTFGPFTELCYGGIVGFEHERFRLGGGYFEHVSGDIFYEYYEVPPYAKPCYKDVKSRLLTGYGTVRISTWFDVLGRFDRVDPDTDSKDEKYTPYWDESYDAFTDVIAGSAFKFGGGHFEIVPNYQTRIPEREFNIVENGDGGGSWSYFVPTERRFYVHMELSF
jgi:hypothetical protein